MVPEGIILHFLHECKKVQIWCLRVPILKIKCKNQSYSIFVVNMKFS